MEDLSLVTRGFTPNNDSVDLVTRGLASIEENYVPNKPVPYKVYSKPNPPVVKNATFESVVGGC